MDIFDEINKQVKLNGSRWVEIDKVVNDLKKSLDDILPARDRQMITLLLLLVEQLRPFSNTKIEESQKEISDMIKGMSKMVAEISTDIKK